MLTVASVVVVVVSIKLAKSAAIVTVTITVLYYNSSLFCRQLYVDTW